MVQVYQFDELTDEAKERARDWWRELGLADEWWKNTYEDAHQAGIKIDSFDIDRGHCKGSFTEDACHTAHYIEKNHGDTCETYKTAVAFLKERDAIVNGAEKDEDGEFVNQYELDGKLDECEAEFLKSILEDYRIILSHEWDYINSDEYIDETIRANEYEFTETGKRA